MRSCTLHVANMGFGCNVDLRFDDVPDNGPGDSIINVMAMTEDMAMNGLRKAILGQIPQGPPPAPMANVYDQEGLDSLTIEQLEQATRIDVPIGAN